MNCKKCGFSNPEQSVFCSKCGTSLSKQKTATQESKTPWSLSSKILVVGASFVVVAALAIWVITSMNSNPLTTSNITQRWTAELDRCNVEVDDMWVYWENSSSRYLLAVSDSSGTDIGVTPDHISCVSEGILGEDIMKVSTGEEIEGKDGVVGKYNSSYEVYEFSWSPSD